MRVVALELLVVVAAHEAGTIRGERGYRLQPAAAVVHRSGAAGAAIQPNWDAKAADARRARHQVSEFRPIQDAVAVAVVVVADEPGGAIGPPQIERVEG